MGTTLSAAGVIPAPHRAQAPATTDPFLGELARLLVDCLTVHGPQSRVYAHLLEAVRSRIVEATTRNATFPRPDGSLHPWQEELACSMLRADDEHRSAVAVVASACGLSPGQFSRAFKLGVGVSPQRWRLSQKIDRAQRLMLEGRLSLTEIACECGFAEQSHFNHTFLRIIGKSPGAWRRHQSAPIADTVAPRP